ncbi:hypothetical protein GGI12_005332 [Dipsacomyces acuminosporus]|nr:hypothetical protein GGI12_005332 [Dipsacomyces acuminosporus]
MSFAPKRPRQDAKAARKDGVRAPGRSNAEISGAGDDNDLLEREGTLLIESSPAERQKGPGVLAEDSVHAIPAPIPAHSVADNRSNVSFGSQSSGGQSPLSSIQDDSPGEESAYDDHDDGGNNDYDDDDGDDAFDDENDDEDDDEFTVDIVVPKKGKKEPKSTSKSAARKAAAKPKARSAGPKVSEKPKGSKTAAKAAASAKTKRATKAVPAGSMPKRQNVSLQKTLSSTLQPIKRVSLGSTPTKSNASLGSLLPSPNSAKISRPTLSKSSSSSSASLLSSPTQASGLGRNAAIPAGTRRAKSSGASLRDLLSGSSVPRAGLSRRTLIKKPLHN